MNTNTVILDQRRATPGTKTFTVLQGVLAATMAAPFADDAIAVDYPTFYERFIEKPFDFDGTSSPLLLEIPRGEAYHRLISSIESLKTLPADWDGYGAEQISHRSIYYALLFVNGYREKAESFEPYPDSDGTILLENHWGSNTAYLNFSEAGEIAYVLHTESGIHRGRSFDVVSVNKLLEAIYF